MDTHCFEVLTIYSCMWNVISILVICAGKQVIDKVAGTGLLVETEEQPANGCVFDK